MKKAFVFITGLFLITITHGANAMNVIRDTEIEETVTNYVHQIFGAANLPQENAKIVLLNDPTINAFVAGGQTIFIHTGLITHSKYVDDLIFVLAHETGHIVGGHITRGISEYQKAQKTALISTILGGVLAVASGRPDAGIAVMMGSQTSAMGTFTAYRQVEESSADRIAVDIVKKLGYSMSGFQNIMQLIQAEERLNASENQMTYLRTHPMTSDRKQNIAHFLENPKDEHDDTDFRRIRAKLIAFMDEPKHIKSQFMGSSPDDLYAQSIIAYREHKQQEALILLDKLIKLEPENPYLYELKGQFEFETGHIKSAIQNYRTAVKLKPDAALIRIALAQSLLEQNSPKNNAEAIQNLTVAIQQEHDTALPWRLLATAYDRQKQAALSQYAMAEYYWNINKIGDAEKTAQKALKSMDKNLPQYQQLNDLIEQIKTNRDF